MDYLVVGIKHMGAPTERNAPDAPRGVVGDGVRRVH
jgi:hypothetical protein